MTFFLRENTYNEIGAIHPQKEYFIMIPYICICVYIYIDRISLMLLNTPKVIEGFILGMAHS